MLTNLLFLFKVQVPDLKTITTTPSPPQTSSDQNDCPPCESSQVDCPQCDCSEADRACPEPVLCPPCHCEPQKECICEQAALPLLRQYVKSILTHVGKKVNLLLDVEQSLFLWSF